MKLRGLLVTTLVLCALIGALYWSSHRKPSDEVSSKSADAPSILKLDEGGITKLEIKKKGADSIVLSRTSANSWQIVEPEHLPADESSVSSVLSSISSLNSQRLVVDKATDLKSYGLDEPSLEADISEKDGKSQKLLIGDDTPTGGSVYAALAGDPRVFTIASYSKTSLDKSVNDLRDKRLVTITPDKISRLELTKNNESLEFGRNKEEWQILKPKPLRADNFQVAELVRKVAGARMDFSGSSTEKETEAGFSHGTPVATVKVTDQSGTQELQVRKDKDAYYAKSSVAEGSYKVDSDLGKSLDKGLDDFRNKKVFDFSYNDPAKIEMHNGSKAYFLTRSGADWWSNGKKEDGESVEALVSKLRDLTADKFEDSGFSNPTIQVIVTSDSGKRVENISIAKTGSGYLAKRENEPTLYALSGNSIEELLKAADDVKPAAAPPAKK
ncbi:MAG TPA: DUF4340 domain-containing protein [Candidatus Sulfotelmatobacter sp.]|nr:DUF4340 domain-containing protein [Candidatus Sulfotelmatobacter sp.]